MFEDIKEVFRIRKSIKHYTENFILSHMKRLANQGLNLYVPEGYIVPELFLKAFLLESFVWFSCDILN